MGLVRIATERRVTIAMVTVAILLFGFVSLSRLKLDLLPDLAYPTLTIRTGLVGAAPQEIESLLTKPIEEAVGIIKNVRRVRSVSRTGQSDVTLEFLWGTGMDIAGVEVREKLDVLELPLEADRPLLLRFDPSSEPIMRLALLSQPAAAATSDDRLRFLRRFAEERLKTDLEAVEGTAAVKPSGGREDEIEILVDQQKLAQLDVSIDTVAGRIRAENVNLSGGRLEQGEQRFLVRTINEFQSVDAFGETIIALRRGAPVYLRDVASVTRSYKELEAITRVDGAESVELAIYKEGDANTVQIAGRISDRLQTLRKQLPDGTDLRIVYDQSQFISSAVAQVRGAALWGGLLAILVLYLFLRDARATAIIGIAIPVSVIGTFLAMYSAKLTLNIMSLGGIALAVGMLVDNSIVVLENIVRRRELGASRLEAARSGTGEVATAVTAATLTTVAVFFPMVFISGIAGQLFRDQALTVSFGLTFSLLVALTLIPMLASLGGARPQTVAPESAGRLTRAAVAGLRPFVRLGRAIATTLRLVLALPATSCQRLMGALEQRYPPLLHWGLHHRGAVIGAAAAIFAGTLALVPRLGTELIPQLSQGEFALDLTLPPGTPLARTDAMIRTLMQSADELPGLRLTYSVAGTGNRLDANPVDAGEHTGRLNIVLEPAAAGSEEEVRGHLRATLDRLPGVRHEFSRPELFALAAPLEIELAGYDLEALAAASRQLAAALAASDRLTDVTTSIEVGNPEIHIEFDHERAAALGLVVRDIADRVVASIRGELATRYSWRDRKIDVLVRSVDAREASVEELKALIVNPQSPRPVTLDAVADVRVASGPAEIRRVDQERVAIVSAALARGDLGGAVVEIERLLDRLELPRGVNAAVSGQNEEMQESFRSMFFTLAMAVFLVYLVMASQFESLVYPFVILFTVPLAVIGAVLALFVTGTTVNVVAFIGLIMLAGIVVNNAIVLVDFINQLRTSGLAKAEAIVEAGRARLRPILMTTLTTVLGLLPMALGLGEGAEVRTPMAITVIGGLTTSTLLTLLVIPVVYSLFDRESVQVPSALEGAGA